MSRGQARQEGFPWKHPEVTSNPLPQMRLHVSPLLLDISCQCFQNLAGFPENGQSRVRCLGSSCLCGSSVPFLWVIGLGYRTTSSGDKGIPSKGSSSVFRGDCLAPPYLPQGKSETLAMVVARVDISPVHRDEQSGSERSGKGCLTGVWRLSCPIHVSALPAG